MQRPLNTQFGLGRIVASCLCAASVGMLFSACDSSGVGRKGPTTPDGSSFSDGGAGGTSGTGTDSLASGGTSATGGLTTTGGIVGTGGVTGVGGTIGSGGAPGAGGSMGPNPDAPPDLGADLPASTGGTASTGGIARSGGITGIGGATGGGGVVGGGGFISTGGITGTGGVVGAGGTIGTGGIAGSGGVARTGGITGTGGVTSSGGVAATGGMAGKPYERLGHFQMENLDRGLVAVKVAGGVYVGWRMFGYEYAGTASDVSYNLYRGGTKLASVTDSTNYLDAAGTASSSYTVTPVIKGVEGAQSPAVTPSAQNYLRIPLSPPATSPSGAAYSANDGSAGDLDGDGQYDIVLKWDPSDSRTESQAGTTSNVFLDGYTLAGKRLWRIDLGANVLAGPHYSQFVVYDFDGDGKAELAVKTAPGTKDGSGAFLHMGPAATDDDSAVYRNSSGDVLTGPEYLTVFGGADGKELATVDFEVKRWSGLEHGFPDTSRAYSFLGSAGFVSDSGVSTVTTGRPSILMARGIFMRTTLTAWNWRDSLLGKVWTMDSNAAGNAKYAGQAGHSMMVADVDGDGAQEIISGPSTIGSDGTPRCSTGFGLGAALHVGDLLPSRRGLEVFVVSEAATWYDVHDASTCEVIVKGPASVASNGNGVADDISSSNPGAEMWSAGTTALLSATDGSSVGSKPTSTNFLVYWDADESRELEDGTSVTKYGGGTLLDCAACASNNGAKSTPTLTADLLGDWREEIVWREADNSALRVYTTTDVTARRIYTLMHDPQYRMQVTSEQTGYNQPPHVGFHIGSGMADPPMPDIFVE